MPATKPGLVKNMIRRSLREIVDSSPTKKEERMIWDFFDSECAYCGKKLRKAHKEGHIDHLVSGGSNDISNRVLSCAACNEKEKLDMPWEKFLSQKNPDKIIAHKRRDKILQWQSIHKRKIIKRQILDKIESLSNEVVAFYDKRVKSARELRNL